MDKNLNGIYQRIAAIGRDLGADRIVLYGSRARGDCRARSDIDIAVFGAPETSRAAFLEALDELPTLLDFDLVYFQEKHGKLVSAVARLEESIRDYDAVKLDSIRDGVIQRFEFCTELAWKTLREYLLEQGYSEVNSPKSVMKQAYADGLLDEEQAWIDLLNARNLTSHIYDEATANGVFQKIRDVYCPLFQELIQSLNKQ